MASENTGGVNLGTFPKESDSKRKIFFQCNQIKDFITWKEDADLLVPVWYIQMTRVELLMLFKPCFSVLNRNRSRSGGLSALVMGHLGHSFYFIAEISYTVFLIQLLLFFFFLFIIVLQRIWFSKVTHHQSQDFSQFDDKITAIFSLARYSLSGTAKFFFFFKSHLITTRSIFYSIHHNFTFWIYSIW